MNHDPRGYYERLELGCQAPPEAIHAAYRRKARLLHPDIPGTGNAAAFMAVKEAYDVLADPLRRGAYDRAARGLDRLRSVEVADGAEEIRPDPPAAPPRPIKTRGPRLSDLPFAVWAGLGIIVLLAGGEAVLRLNAPPSADYAVEVPATAPSVPPQVPPPPPRPIRLIGNPNVYVIPAAGPALVLRYDQQRHAFIPIGQLPAFSAVQALRVLRRNGLVEIRLTDTATGFMDAYRLEPGNVAEARQAYCTYNSGPPPANGEILARHGAGAGQTMIENRSGQPMVVKLRDRGGVTAATVYLAPGGEALVGGLPGGAYRPDYAIGELWSRACNSFAAGMRAQRFPSFAELSTLGTLAIPPELPGQVPPLDISDQDFERD
ncbi:MAG TPA: J domain-containing protein [Acetobacteraceae bacterium]|nr:J domain-containing protein [Acetobacteraceae bacterium]